MSTIGIAELREHAEELVSRVEATGETMEIIVGGRVAAHLIAPPRSPERRPFTEADRQKTLDALRSLRELGDEISADWPDGLSVVDALRADPDGR